jgi:hypothetical protein
MSFIADPRLHLPKTCPLFPRIAVSEFTPFSRH